MIERVCKREGCGQSFRSYPSSNKRYCSPPCRYSDPELAKLLNRNISGRHVLTQVDPVNRRAVCSVCGPADIIRRGATKQKHARAQLWRCQEALRAREWARKLGVSVEQVEELRRIQNGFCAICRRAETEVGRLHVDHCHTTGRLRGLLCSQCNTALGLMKDNPARLRAAAEYLGADP